MASGNYAKFIIRVSIGAMVLAGCEGKSMDQIFGIGDENPPTDQISPSPKPKPTPTPTPPPTPTPTPPGESAVLKRNMQFDAMRSKGIAQVYQQELDPAVATFNSAYHIKPNDRSVGLWLDAIKNAEAKAAKAFSDANRGTGGANPEGQFKNPPGVATAPGAPGAPPVINPNLVNTAKGGMAPPPANQSQVDPRLVF